MRNVEDNITGEIGLNLYDCSNFFANYYQVLLEEPMKSIIIT